jgi:hypothetical protein
MANSGTVVSATGGMFNGKGHLQRRIAMRIAPDSPVLNLAPIGDLTVTADHGISIARASADSPAKKSRFVLFSEEWLNLQMYIQSVFELPITQGDFDEKYGDFDSGDRSLIEGAVDAMRDVRALSDVFGTPEIVVEQLANDPDYLTDGKSKCIYAHIVWLATKMQYVANKFDLSVGLLKERLDPDRNSSAEQKKYLQTVLMGRNGLVSRRSQ